MPMETKYWLRKLDVIKINDDIINSVKKTIEMKKNEIIMKNEWWFSMFNLIRIQDNVKRIQF